MCLDLGLGHTGVAIWNNRLGRFTFTHCIVTKKQAGYVSLSNIARVRETTAILSKLLKRFNVKLVLAEVPHGGSRNAVAGRAMALAVGGISAFVELTGVRFVALTPDNIKRVVSPQKEKVSKEMVQAFVEVRFGKHHLPDTKELREHIADAMVCMDAYRLQKDSNAA